MAVVKELLVANVEKGTLDFGDYTLTSKSKKDGVVLEGENYKVKTYNQITRLEKNENMIFESVPGTAVFDFTYEPDVIEFKISAPEDVSFTVDVEENTEYELFVDGVHMGTIETNVSGKLNASVEVDGDKLVHIKIVKLEK
ncbi:MAG: endosialidase [Lachnospiraceae bacterium]|jgi:hypothetical protein|nr:endosialidase [Lachnospiraceae bacterium]